MCGYLSVVSWCLKRSILRVSESRDDLFPPYSCPPVAFVQSLPSGSIISEAKDIKRKEQRERFLFALFFLQANSDAESDGRVVGAVECVVRYVR